MPMILESIVWYQQAKHSLIGLLRAQPSTMQSKMVFGASSFYTPPLVQELLPTEENASIIKISFNDGNGTPSGLTQSFSAISLHASTD
jgi:hypothetical protein